YIRLCALAKAAGYSDVGDFALQAFQVQMLVEEIREQNISAAEKERLIADIYDAFNSIMFNKRGQKDG
ncbi:MAG: hypothetical protein ABF449_13010, partial [Ethanoligenens sp.]